MLLLWSELADCFFSVFRFAAKQVLERLTYSAFENVVRALVDKDRFIFALMLALEVEDAEGRVAPGEREFLVSPAYGGSVAGALGLLVFCLLSFY